MELEEAIPGVRVGDTPYGQGVFATRRFRPDETVATVHGHLIHDPDYTSDYCIDLSDEWSLEPEGAMAMLNHCCEPNCELQVIADDDQPIETGEVVLVAVAPVLPGEQLTIDYCWPAEGTIPCLCGAAGCRGWIVDPEELPLLERQLSERDEAPQTAEDDRPASFGVADPVEAV